MQLPRVAATLTLDDVLVLPLSRGNHATCADGCCAMEKAHLIRLAGEGHELTPSTPLTDADTTISRVLSSYVTRLNDRWDDEHRQLLDPFVRRLPGTADDRAADVRRGRLAARFAATRVLPVLLRAAGLDAEADEAAACGGDGAVVRRVGQAASVVREKALTGHGERGFAGYAPAAAAADAAGAADAAAYAAHIDASAVAAAAAASAAAAATYGAPAYAAAAAAAASARRTVSRDVHDAALAALQPAIIECRTLALELLDQLIDAPER